MLVACRNICTHLYSMRISCCDWRSSSILFRQTKDHTFVTITTTHEIQSIISPLSARIYMRFVRASMRVWSIYICAHIKCLSDNQRCAYCLVVISLHFLCGHSSKTLLVDPSKIVKLNIDTLCVWAKCEKILICIFLYILLKVIFAPACAFYVVGQLLNDINFVKDGATSIICGVLVDWRVNRFLYQSLVSVFSQITKKRKVHVSSLYAA